MAAALYARTPPPANLRRSPAAAPPLQSPPAVTWEQPYSSVNLYEVVSLVNNGGRPEVPAPAALRGGAFPGLPAYTALLRRCWAQNPYDRPSFAELVPELRALLEAEAGGGAR